MWSKLAAVVSIPLLAAAIPSGIKVRGDYGPMENHGACPVMGATLTFPEGQTALSIPYGQVPNYITLGTGVQNYTCSDAGTYAYVPGLDSLQKQANTVIDFVDLLVPSPNCTTSLACMVPQHSKRSRTSGTTSHLR
jgi:hypothetical protein